jgi:hypothetical protein
MMDLFPPYRDRSSRRVIQINRMEAAGTWRAKVRFCLAVSLMHTATVLFHSQRNLSSNLHTEYPWRIWGSHNGSYECCHLLEYRARLVQPNHLLHVCFLLRWFFTLKMEVKHFSEASVHIRTTRLYIPKDGNIQTKYPFVYITRFLNLNHWVMHPVARVSTNISRNLRTQQMSVLVLLCSFYTTSFGPYDIYSNWLWIFCITNHLKMATNRGRNM